MSQPRIETQIQATFVVNELTARGCIENINSGGLFCATRKIPSQGESVGFQFKGLDGGTIEVSGVVWWNTLDCQILGGQPPGFGVRLVETTDSYRHLISELRKSERAGC